MRNLKRSYNSTMVSMTDATGKTGNVDYRDCSVPDNKQLAVAAKKYGLSKDIKFTITSVVGTKTKFVADVVDDDLQIKTDVKTNMYGIQKAFEELYIQEKEKLDMCKDLNLSKEEYLVGLGIDRNEVLQRVVELRKGVWRLFGDEYKEAMFNYVVVSMYN